MLKYVLSKFQQKTIITTLNCKLMVLNEPTTLNQKQIASNFYRSKLHPTFVKANCIQLLSEQIASSTLSRQIASNTLTKQSIKIDYSVSDFANTFYH